MFARRHFLACKTIAVVVLSLLFSQLSLAAYACPATPVAAGTAAGMAAGGPCEGGDADQPGRCHQHGVDLARLQEPVQVVAALSLPVLVQVIHHPVTADLHDVVALPRASAPEARPPPDPIFLSTLRLRV